MSATGATLDVTLEAAVHAATDGVLVIDRNRAVVFASDACRRITGADWGSQRDAVRSPESGSECFDELGSRLESPFIPAMHILRGESDSDRRRIEFRRPCGFRVPVETSFTAIRSDLGDVIGVVAILRELAGDETSTSNRRLPTANDENSCSQPGAPAAAGDTLDGKLSALERSEIIDALRHTNGQRTLAAERLGISRSRLYRRMDALGIEPRELGLAGDA